MNSMNSTKMNGELKNQRLVSNSINPANRYDSEEYDEYMAKGNENRHKNVQLLSEHFRNILIDIGEDPTKRQGLFKTPERAAKAFCYYTCGYNIKLEGKF